MPWWTLGDFCEMSVGYLLQDWAANRRPCLLQRIQYSKTDSDAVAKMKGTYVETQRKRPAADGEAAPKKSKKKKAPQHVASATAAVAGPHLQSQPMMMMMAPGAMMGSLPEQPPNQILFLTNLPEETNEMMLSMLFNQ